MAVMGWADGWVLSPLGSMCGVGDVSSSGRTTFGSEVAAFMLAVAVTC